MCVIKSSKQLDARSLFGNENLSITTCDVVLRDFVVTIPSGGMVT